MAPASDALPIPGLRWGMYPQRRDDGDDGSGGSGGQGGGGSQGGIGGTGRRRGRQHGASRLGWWWRPGPRGTPRPDDWPGRVRRIQARAADWQRLERPALEQLRQPISARFARDGMTAAATDAAAALVVEMARRVLGRSAYDGQVQAAIAMNANVLVEMATGEGKSLATALAAAIAALAGIPVHVLTANDYLVGRDAETFAPLFRALGLTVAPVLATTEASERRAAYRCAIVYTTAREVAFDYLRDRMTDPGLGAAGALVDRLSRPAGDDAAPMLRGLCLAIIDEADSILIDEAQMPLVLSRERQDPQARAAAYQAWLLSARLQPGVDFTVLESARQVLLEPAGQARLETLAAPLAHGWRHRLHREQQVVAALTARHALVRDRDYLVTAGKGKGKDKGKDKGKGKGKPEARDEGDDRASHEASNKVSRKDCQIELIDSVTGRVATGRRWSAGIHALVAIKEGLKPEDDLETLDQITFQRFFRRYHRLGGSSGTLAEARGELRRIYGLAIVRIAPRLPSRRLHGPTRWFADDAARDRALVARVRDLVAQRRCVLIGTDSVGDTRRVGAALAQAGVDHAVLDARFDAEEAGLVARAGEAGAVTVSTNMAGRGTDIALADAARAAGGLHVLLCQHNDSRRHDRQLAGRAARQGDPGSCEHWLSLDDRRHGTGERRHPAARSLAPFVDRDEVRLPAALLAWVQAACQRIEERRRERRRARMLRDDRQMRRELSFSGPD